MPGLASSKVLGCAHECAGQAMQACYGEVCMVSGSGLGRASNPGPPRQRSQFDTQLDCSDSDEPLVCCGRFAVLSSASDNEAAVAVRRFE